MDKLTEIMMLLVRYGIDLNPVPSEWHNSGLSDAVLRQLYRLSKSHDMAHLVGFALEDNQLLREDNLLADKYKQQIMMAVYRYKQLDYELKQVIKVFEEAQIPFIPLKGSVLRDYYPQPWMRTSCDVDILVHEEDLEKASNVLTTKLSYQLDTKGPHDIAFNTPSGMHIELHYDLIEKDVNGKSEQPLKDVWSYTYVKPNSMQYHMVDEMFYYYHIAHMAKHFVYGGCGIRPFIDLWVLNHRMPYDESKRRKLLQKGGLLAFEQAAVKLSETWLSGAEPDTIIDSIQEFVLHGGVYGNTENRVAVQQQKKGGKFRYMISRIFLPYSVLKYHYPILQKHKWLFPLMEVRRWFKLVFRGGFKRSANELKINQNMSAERQAEIANMMKQLGL